MIKYILLTCTFAVFFLSNSIAQNTDFNKIEIKFKDGEVIQFDLNQRDDKRYHNAIMVERCYEIVYRKIQGENTYRQVSEMPKFNKGSGDLKSYISKHLNYPQEAINQNLEGIVYVGFIIDKTGKTTHVSIARGVGPELDKAALSLINSLPEWTPGKLEGELVDIKSTVPIRFKLK